MAFFNLVATRTDLTSRRQANNSFDCVKQCTDQNDCNSVFFDKIKKECWPQTSVFISPSDTAPKPGFRYFRINSGEPISVSVLITVVHLCIFMFFVLYLTYKNSVTTCPA